MSERCYTVSLKLTGRRRAQKFPATYPLMLSAWFSNSIVSRLWFYRANSRMKTNWIALGKRHVSYSRAVSICGSCAMSTQFLPSDASAAMELFWPLKGCGESNWVIQANKSFVVPIPSSLYELLQLLTSLLETVDPELKRSCGHI